MEPLAVLARLPFPVYITTNPDNMLGDALIEAGKEPRVELCQWHSREGTRWPRSVFRTEKDYRPTIQQPLVYHLFGRLKDLDSLDSLVITEDDYFDYLIGTTSNDRLIPKVVSSALVNTPLLFLGFRMDDWNFRVLFRSILGREGSLLLGKYAHVAVQIDPEEGRILEPEGAKAYLQKYFGDAKISIYWGSAEDFLREMATLMDGASRSPAGMRIGGR